jgi:hypothetical protein
MKGNLGNEVLLRVETLNEVNSTTTDLLRALVNTWSAKRCRPVALCRIRTWGITKDGKGYHHLLPTPQPWNTRQTKVTCSLDTTSTLTATTLVLARNFCLYQESSTRASAMRIDDELAS